MENKTRPLLLTWNINPHQQNLLSLYNPSIRYRQYIDNLIKLITITNFTHFVFCENSNTWVKDQKMLELLCEYYGKKIEFLTFSWDEEKTKQLTRAFWDQEIMEYAVKNSTILSEFEWFYKLTWRYRIKNPNKIIQNRENQNNVFIRWWLWKDTIHTCFFKVTKSYFIEHFDWKADQLPRFENHSLERLYYYYVKQSWVNMTVNWIHPIFSWERGSWWVIDESPLMQLKTKIFAKLWVYDINTTPVVKTKKSNYNIST